MLAVMFVLLETYEPEPNRFRFDTVTKIGSFAVLTSAPVFIGLAVRSLLGAALIGLLQAISPLALLGNMQDPNSDLNFAILLWWFPLPAIAVLIVIIDHIVGQARRTKREPLRVRSVTAAPAGLHDLWAVAS